MSPFKQVLIGFLIGLAIGWHGCIGWAGKTSGIHDLEDFMFVALDLAIG